MGRLEDVRIYSCSDRLVTMQQLQIHRQVHEHYQIRLGLSADRDLLVLLFGFTGVSIAGDSARTVSMIVPESNADVNVSQDG